MKVSARTKGSPAVPAGKDKDGKDIPAQPAQPARGPVEVELAIPESLDDLVKSFGKEVVAAHAQGSIIISAQAMMRRYLDKGKTQPEIQKEMSAWKPDLRTSGPKQSAFEKASSSLDKLSPQERADLLKKLQGMKS